MSRVAGGKHRLDESEEEEVKESDMRPPPSKKPRRAAPAPGSLTDGGARDSMAAVKADIARRTAFEEYDTRLLLAWLLDYKDGRTFLPPDKDTDRVTVLNALVNNNAAVPHDLAEIQEVWRAQHLGDAGDSPARDPAWLTERADEDQTGGIDAVAPSRGGAATATQHKGVSLTPIQVHLGSTAPVGKQRPRVSLRPTVSQSGGDEDDGDPWPECLTCGVEPPAGAVSRRGAFTCQPCGFRGDLDIDHHINVALRADRDKRAGHEALAGGKGQFHADTNSTASTTASTKQLTALQRHFIVLKDGGKQHKSCTAAANEGFGVEGAQALSSHAMHALLYEPPSQELVDLIRWGRLTSVAFAVPRLVHRMDSNSDTAVGTLQVGVDGGTTFTPKDPRPEPVKDMASFVGALVGTILPALVDKPAAIANWCAFARSVMGAYTECGGSWAAAAQYMDMALRSAVTEDAPLGNPVLSAIHTARSVALPCAAGPVPQRQPQLAPSSEVCLKWNRRTCDRTPCRYSHTCQACGGKHRAVDVPACAGNMQGLSVIVNKDMRGSRGGRSVRSSGGSVITRGTGTRDSDTQETQ